MSQKPPLESYSDVVISPRVTLPLFPAEILADIIELAIITSTPCPLLPPTPTSSTNDSPPSPFTTALRSTYTSSWAWLRSLLYVNKFFYSIARPLLLRTITLETPSAAQSFFRSISSNCVAAVDTLARVQRAWLGNLSALERETELRLDPVGLRLSEAAWWEECAMGGFVVGHAYASRLKQKRRDKGKGRTREEEESKRERERRYRTVSVYWAEEQLVEEVSDPGFSTDSEDSDTSNEDTDDIPEGHRQNDLSRLLPLLSTSAQRSQQNGVSPSQRRSSHNSSESSRDPRIDRPQEPAWQTLYSRQRYPLPIRTRAQPISAASTSDNSAPRGPSMSWVGPAEGDLDPWDMQDAQDRLAALANSPSVCASSVPLEHAQDLESEPVDPSCSPSPLASAQQQIRHSRRNREIYAYHLTTATLDPFINPLLSSLRSLRLITLTFYPGHLLDDDKLEHMLRRILSPSECPRLQTLLIRIVFDTASAGSRMRRFERTKTIAGAADRIGDERVRVMLVNDSVGQGKLVALPKDEGVGSGVGVLTRKAISLTMEGWWSRVLQQNHSSYGQELPEIVQSEEDEVGASGEVARLKRERKLSNWQMFFPPQQVGSSAHLINLIYHCDAWPDCPDPIA